MDVIAGVVFITLLAVGPVLCVRYRGRAGWRWFLLGIASWVMALAAKSAIQLALEAMTTSAALQGGLGGIVSALCELGAAALFLRRRDLRGSDLIAFGVGIGAFEVLFVMVLGWTTESGPSSVVWWVTWIEFFVERSLAMIVHVASRVLVHVALRIRNILPALIAVFTFASVDGLASYGWAAGWNWEAAHVLVPVLGFIAIMGGLEAWAAWWFWRKTDLHWLPDESR